MLTRYAKGAVYVGQDPTGGGVIRLPIELMTPEQLAAWVAIDPATALRYVDPTKIPRYRAPRIDNAPGAPLPKLPKDDNRATKAKDKDDKGA
jgi:hypothetical protein